MPSSPSFMIKMPPFIRMPLIMPMPRYLHCKGCKGYHEGIFIHCIMGRQKVSLRNVCVPVLSLLKHYLHSSMMAFLVCLLLPENIFLFFQSTPVDSVIFRGLLARDPDSNVNGQVEYFIENEADSLFKIELPHQVHPAYSYIVTL